MLLMFLFRVGVKLGRTVGVFVAGFQEGGSGALLCWGIGIAYI
jgi:hypothetical protein